MDFTFDRNISKEVLENYLSRAVTAAGLYESDTLEDDLRAIREMGVKFLGRASGIWYMTENDEEHLNSHGNLPKKYMSWIRRLSCRHVCLNGLLRT